MLPLSMTDALMALLIFAGTVEASQSRSRSAYAVKDSHHVPRRWKAVGPAPGKHLIRLQIGLKQGNFKELERHLYEGNVGIYIIADLMAASTVIGSTRG